MGSRVGTFLVGLVLGTLLGAVGVFSLGERYTIIQGGNEYTVLKVDRWTGKSWISWNIPDTAVEWQEIGQ